MESEVCSTHGLKQFDATASLLQDFFTDQPDFTPYVLRPVDKRLSDPDVAFKPFDRRFNWKGLLESPRMDDLDDMRRDFEKTTTKTPRH